MPRSRSDALVESLAMLKRTPLLAGCDDATLNALALTSHLRPLAARETLYAQDDDAEMMYLVVAGVVAVILTTPDGRELIIGEIRAGEWLGEVALLTGLPHSTGAIALQAAAVITIPRNEFASRILANHCVAQRLLMLLAGRLAPASNASVRWHFWTHRRGWRERYSTWTGQASAAM